jgi:alpha-ketoglutarate-dependent 2,4-dichlorophenoxyacetate dioxygenase
MAHDRTAADALLQARPLTPSFGVEVCALDLSEPLPPAAAAELRALFDQHLVLLFRDQRLLPERHIAFARNFGPLEVHVLDQYHADRHPELFVLSNVGPDGRPNQVHPDRGTLVWHTDASFQRCPALATILYAEAVPQAGGHTLFADTLSAFEALSLADQEWLAAKRAVHDLSVSREKAGYGPLPAEQGVKVPAVEHPLVRTHPPTGRRGLYLGSHAQRIAGLPDVESAGLIERLIAHITEPRFVYDHAWRAGDLLMWDNRAVLHRATEYDTAVEPRIVRRAVVAGDEPF